jgi:hypothetical protein
MWECLSPFCAGLVTAESSTEGHCGLCGLHHRRRAGADVWEHLVGPLTVTLSGATIGTGTAPSNHEVIEADAVRFRDRFLTIDANDGTIRIEPIGRLVHVAGDAP